MVYWTVIQNKTAFAHHNFPSAIHCIRAIGLGAIVANGGDTKAGDTNTNKQKHNSFAEINKF